MLISQGTMFSLLRTTFNATHSALGRRHYTEKKMSRVILAYLEEHGKPNDDAFNRHVYGRKPRKREEAEFVEAVKAGVFEPTPKKPVPWTEEEKKRLLECVKLYGKKWKKIVEFFPGRTSRVISAYYHNIKMNSSEGLTDEDKEIILRWYKERSAKGERINWIDLKRNLPIPKPMKYIKDYIYELERPFTNRRWTEEEFQKLRELVLAYKKDWDQITAKMSHRTEQQCRMKWHYESLKRGSGIYEYSGNKNHSSS